jgi:hypothetical protein
VASFIFSFPFLLTVLAATIAGASGILLRRTAAIISPALSLPAWLLLVASAAAYTWSFLWAWGWEVVRRPAGIVTGVATYGPAAFTRGHPSPVPLVEVIAGWILVLGGVALAGWALSERMREWRFRWPARKRLTLSPYAQLRRPAPLALMLAALGATLVVGTGSAWICLLAALIGYSALLELGDWEARRRSPELADYFRTTPRYLHHFWGRR